MHPFEDHKRRILERIDILRVASDHVALKRRGRRYVGLCCFHTEKSPSFTVNPDLGLFKCFGCGKGGDIFRFVELKENVSFPEALRILADRVGLELAPRSAAAIDSGEPGRADIAAVNTWAAKLFRNQLVHEVVGQSTREYLAGRRISAESIERFGLGLALGHDGRLVEHAAKAGFSPRLLLAADLRRAGDDGATFDSFRDRLMFPIRDVTGRVVGFGGRTLRDHPAKYINTRQTVLFEKGRGLYGLDLGRDAIAREGEAIIVEGYTDCIALHQAGFSNSAAALGTALTEDHIELLRRYCDRVVLLFDSDEAGQAAAERAITLALPKGLQVRLTRLKDGKDPGEFFISHGAEAFRDVLNDAVDALEFGWSGVLARFRGSESNHRRREAVVEFLSLLGAAWEGNAVDAIHRGLLVNQVAHLLRMDREEAVRLMRPARSAARTGTTKKQGDASDSPSSPVQRDVEQVGWRVLIGSLLLEPGLASSLPEPLPMARIADDRDRAILEILLALSRRLGDFALSDVFAACRESSTVERVVELSEEASLRGNPAASIDAAWKRIERGVVFGELEQSKDRLRDQRNSGAAAGAEVDLRAVVDGLRSHRHFAPRRMVRQIVGGSGGAGSMTDGKPATESEQQ